MSRTTRRVPAVRLRADGEATSRPDTVAGEEPLEIRLDGETWLVTMRTPGDDVDLVHGLLHAEGVIDAADQIRRVVYGPGVEPGGRLSYNVVDVVLDGGARRPHHHDRAVYVSASCGICGTSSLDALARTSPYPVAEIGTRVPLTTLLALPDRLRSRQRLFDSTGGVHAAGLFAVGPSGGDTTLAVREDVGRHNAVDKVIGWAMREGRLPLHDVVLQVSGRLSYELVQKSSMAGVPVLAAVSAPSGAAVDLAAERGMTLAGFSRGTSVQVYTRADRVT
jgi:FdhD protein